MSNFYGAPVTYEGLTYQNNEAAFQAQIKMSVMAGIVKAKFEQNEELAKKLLATGDAYLEEGNDWGDRIWGTVNGQGANCLGMILMNTREELARERERTTRKPK